MAKINEIAFNNYRAFYGEHAPIPINGKNLLVYGENGSGKSSFCKALHDLVWGKIDSPHAQHRYAKDWSVTFEINKNPDIPQKLTLSSPDSGDKLSQEYLKSAQSISPFLDYKKILRLYLKDESEQGEINLLPILEKLLANYPVAEKGGKLLKELGAEKGQYLATVLNTDLKESLSAILATFKLDIVINGFTCNAVGDPLTLTAELFGEPVVDYHEFLNEARLSALSISIYFAAIKKLSSLMPNRLDILVLDDILIGLDMGNRLAVFDILKNHFADTQTFFFTYDRAWYEAFKDRVEDTEKWFFYEMYAQSVKENGHVFERPFIRPNDDFWMKARQSCDNFNYDQCGNLLRKEMEKQIDGYLGAKDGNLEQKLHLANIKNQSKVILDQVQRILEAIQKAEQGNPTDPRSALISMQRTMTEIKNNFGIDSFFYLKELKNRICNPSSHNDSLRPFYKQELENSFDAIIDLMKTNNIEIEWSSDRPCRHIRPIEAKDSETQQQQEEDPFNAEIKNIQIVEERIKNDY
ncbi:MAG TPA: hypothetical protein PKH10_00170 [bacterium]|nr:hypothetical protein [bacterium]